MIFTQEQINEIKHRLALSGIKDSQLPLVGADLNGEEYLVIIQDGQNKRIPLSSVISNVDTSKLATVATTGSYTDLKDKPDFLPGTKGRVDHFLTGFISEGYMLFDTNLGKLCIWHNNKWIDTNGEEINVSGLKPFEPIDPGDKGDIELS